MTKVISLLNEKGGVGKTTLATTIAAYLAKSGLRTLLVDADPQGNATQSYGFDPYPGFYDWLYRGENLASLVKAVPAERVVQPDEASDLTGQLWMLGGNIETRNIVNQMEEVEVLLDRMLELDAQNVIDVVILDTPPTPTLMTSAIYLASDAVMYPVRLEVWGMSGLARSVSYLSRVNKKRAADNLTPVEFIGVVPVATRYSTTEHTENFKLLVSYYGHYEEGGKVHQGLPQRIVWAEAAAARRSIFAWTSDQVVVDEASRIGNMVMTYASKA